jgi:N-acetyl-alpha-D-glucosaminyl L-malate synthase BshA
MSKSPAPTLRIGVVCFSTFGGSGVVAAEVATSLARRGHSVHVFSDDVPGRLDPAQPNVAFHKVAPPAYPQLKHSPYTLALTSKIVETSRRERLDVIHAHYALPHAVSAHLAREVLAADAGGRTAAPKLVTTLHGTDITLVGSDPSFLPLTRFSIVASDAVTTPSAWLARATHETLGVPDTVDIEIVPNFVDAERFRPAPGERPLPEAPIVVHVSNFRPVKRVGDVVEVFARLRATRPARLRLVGDGPDRAAVAARVTALGLDADVEFLGERVDLPAVLRDADLFVLPSETESFGLAALEAMACGVPVVASAVGGLPEVIPDGEVGALCPLGDVEAMAAAAIRILGDPALHRRLSRAARRLAESRYRIEPAVDRYLAIYQRVLRRAPAARPAPRG